MSRRQTDRTPGLGAGRQTRRRLAGLLLAVLALAATALVAPPQASAAYLVGPAQLTPVEGCRTLYPGEVGIKVQIVQRHLGMPGRFEIMDATTVAAVRAAQSRLGLPKTGVVNRRTWRAMGITEDWCIDRFQASVQVGADATVAQRRAQVIRYAQRYVGQEYVWGGAGPRGYGFDCAGLILQALYSAGIDPYPVTIDQHLRPDYRTTIYLYKHGRKVPAARAIPGDLVFYTNGRYISHMAVYLGDGQTVEASSTADRVRYGNWYRSGRMPYVVRVA